jgi:hypothetical protein
MKLLNDFVKHSMFNFKSPYYESFSMYVWKVGVEKH